MTLKLAGELLLCAAAATLCARAETLTLSTLAEGSATGLATGPGGALYGSTTGSVFSLTPPPSAGGPWAEAVLYSFINTATDGADTNGVVAGPGGVLYGTNATGGQHNCGTVFALTPPASPGAPWTEAVLHQFNNDDGCNPRGNLLIGSGGVLYGITTAGGIGLGNGTVFSMTPPATAGGAWSETVLHRFAGSDDGATPNGLAMGADGALYGITQYGGSSNLGTVFAIAPQASNGGAWAENVVFSLPGFTGDGWNPTGVAVGRRGVVYAITANGGNSNFGTAFSLTPPATSGGPWTETVIHQFGFDEMFPNDLAMAPNGVLLGTTLDGGDGAGTLFSLTPPAAPGGSWSAARFSFSEGVKGSHPTLVVIGPGVLYGSTSAGGSTETGTVFSLAP
jgi:uncharacterized repeat protein (TIGR03803 family)